MNTPTLADAIAAGERARKRMLTWPRWMLELSAYGRQILAERDTKKDGE